MALVYVPGLFASRLVFLTPFYDAVKVNATTTIDIPFCGVSFRGAYGQKKRQFSPAVIYLAHKRMLLLLPPPKLECTMEIEKKSPSSRNE